MLEVFNSLFGTRYLDRSEGLKCKGDGHLCVFCLDIFIFVKEKQINFCVRGMTRHFLSKKYFRFGHHLYLNRRNIRSNINIQTNSTFCLELFLLLSNAGDPTSKNFCPEKKHKLSSP